MTPLRELADRLEGLEKAATPGEWLQSSSMLICDKEARIIANCIPLTEIPELAISFDQVAHNATLISTLRNAAPQLIQSLRRLAALEQAIAEAKEEHGFSAKTAALFEAVERADEIEKGTGK